MVTPTSVDSDTDVELDSVVEHWSDLELCEALYWLRRARQRNDPAMMRTWTDRMNYLLDLRRLEHGLVAVA
jgi:hypothetical protein